MRFALAAKCGCFGASGLRRPGGSREQTLIAHQAREAEDAEAGADTLEEVTTSKHGFFLANVTFHFGSAATPRNPSVPRHARRVAAAVPLLESPFQDRRIHRSNKCW